MTVLLFSVFFSLSEISFGALYNGKYFDSKNMLQAECVVKEQMQKYEYLGNRDKTVDGESCAPWNWAANDWFSTATDSQKKQKESFESFHHSKCRSFQLFVPHPMRPVYSGDPNSAAAWRAHGPWCYVEKEGTDGTNFFNFTPTACFPECDKSKIESGSRRKKVKDVGYSIQKLNYNPTLIDSIDKLFADYQFGDKNYYTHKKSQEQPPEFFELRRRVFLILCLVFLAVITWILSCFFLKKCSQKMHRQKQKALQGFYDSTNLADIKLQMELRRETEDA